MALFWLTVNSGKKGNGAIHCDYINREGHFSSGEKAKELVSKGVIHLPPWAQSARDFFSEADIFERKNGSPYKSIDVALPCELNHEQNIQLAEEIVELVCQDKVGAWAIHSKQAELGNAEQIHVHIMVSERIVIDPPEKVKPSHKFFARYNPGNPDAGGYKKDRRLTSHGRNKYLVTLREKIADLINDAYHRTNINIKISAKSLATQKEEARNNGDNKLAEFFDRETTKYYPMKIFKQMQKAIKASCALDHTDLIPTLLVLNSDAFKKIINEDIATADLLIQRSELQHKKYQLMQRMVHDGEITLSVLTKNFGAYGPNQILYALKQLQNKIKFRHKWNEIYIKLINYIYSNAGYKLTLYDFATKGIYRRVRKAQAELASLNKQKDYLLLIHEYVANDPINKEIAFQQQSLNELTEKCKQIAMLPEAKSRYLFAYQKLKERRTERITKCAAMEKENCVLNDLKDDIGLMLKSVSANDFTIYPKKVVTLIINMYNASEISSLPYIGKELKKQLNRFNTHKDEIIEDKIIKENPPKNCKQQNNDTAKAKQSRRNNKDNYWGL